MKIAIASDHAGFELKEKIKGAFPQFEMTDFGCFNEDSMDYPDVGFPAAEAVRDGNCEKGILICGTGLGMSYVANKVKGIRAALCQTSEFAKLSREHNHANVLVLSGRFISFEKAKEIIDTWFSTEFIGGRHQKRIDKITKYERDE